MQETSHSGVLITIQDIEAVFKVGKDMKVWMKIYLVRMGDFGGDNSRRKDTRW